MKGCRTLSVTLAALITFATGPVGATPGARLPFLRFWTGHPTFGYLLAGAQGPGVFTSAPDGQLVSIWTVEDFRGVGGGPLGYQVVFDPDWQVLPSGTFTTRAQIECFDPAAMALSQEFFSFP